MVAFVPQEDDLALRLHLLVKLKKAQVKFKMSPVMLKGGSATSAGGAGNGAASPGVVSSTAATTAGVEPSLLQDIAKYHVAPTTRPGKNTPSRKTSLLWRLEEVNFLFYAEDELVKRADFLAKKLPAEKNCAVILSRDGKLALLLHEKITPSSSTAGSGTGTGMLTSRACVDEASFVFRHKSDLRTLAADDEQTSLDGTTMTTAAGAVLAATKNRVTQADVEGYGPQLHGPPFQYEDGFAAEDEEESAVVTDWVMETPSDVIFGGPQSRTAARNFVFVFVMSCVVLCCSYVWGSLLGPFARRRSVILQGGGSGPGGNFLLGVGGRDADLEESTARILQDPGHSDSEDVGPPQLKDLRHSRVDDAVAGAGPLRQIAKLPAVISSKQKKRTQRDGYGQLALTPASPEVPAAVVGRNSGVLPPPRISEGADAELRLVAPENRQELSQLATPSIGRNADRPSSSISRPADARRPQRHEEEMLHAPLTRRAILLQVSLAALFLSIIFATAHAAYYLVFAHLDLLPPKLFWGANDGLRYLCRVEPGKKFTSSALPESSSFRQAYCTQELSDTFRQFELLFIYKLSFIFLLWMFSEKVIGQAIWDGGSFADTAKALGMRGAWGASAGSPGEDEAMEEGGGSALTARTVAE
eukprot:g4614.t1